MCHFWASIPASLKEKHVCAWQQLRLPSNESGLDPWVYQLSVVLRLV